MYVLIQVLYDIIIIDDYDSVVETYPETQKIFLSPRNIANMAHHVEKWDKALQKP